MRCPPSPVLVAMCIWQNRLGPLLGVDLHEVAMNGAEADDTGNAAKLVYLDNNSEEVRGSPANAKKPGVSHLRSSTFRSARSTCASLACSYAPHD